MSAAQSAAESVRLMSLVCLDVGLDVDDDACGTP